MRRRKNNIVTLVAKNAAYIGYKFIFRDHAKCRQCNHFNVCCKLEAGRIYEVIKIIKSNSKLSCLVTDEEMQPVEVRLGIIRTCIRAGAPFDTDVIVHWHRIDCENLGCRYRKLCFPMGLEDGDKIRIKDIHGKIGCPLNINLLEIDAELV